MHGPDRTQVTERDGGAALCQARLADLRQMHHQARQDVFRHRFRRMLWRVAGVACATSAIGLWITAIAFPDGPGATRPHPAYAGWNTPIKHRQHFARWAVPLALLSVGGAFTARRRLIQLERQLAVAASAEDEARLLLIRVRAEIPATVPSPPIRRRPAEGLKTLHLRAGTTPERERRPG